MSTVRTTPGPPRPGGRRHLFRGAGPSWTGPDWHTAWLAVAAMLVTAVFFGVTTGLGLAWVLFRALAYLA